ncbi:MAG: haloacid dehalogenase [Neptuniibacter caesariensis]|uniref:Haloacid dehalogenase n=1 Tax=Neptuniibacter caesariensis TaxID=207954 RepID=A0A2G6JB19_NEPCE|nr:MAG: haloacid dehalogenase [Neptuniibacter caesariensis]
MIRCITFDLDDTLWEVNPVIRHANQSMFSWLAENAPEFTRIFQLQDLAKLRKTALQAAPEIAHSVTRIRQAQLKHGLLAAGYSEADAELLGAQAFAVFIQARQEVVFFEHAREMLAALKAQGFQLGVLSNGNADIHHVGLADLIDFQFKADDVGQMKPHPLMFEQMLSHTRLRPEQVIHVGDNPEHDVQGAAAMGIWTIWVNLNGLTSPVKPDATISCLSEMGEAVAAIAKKAEQRVRL